MVGRIERCGWKSAEISRFRAILPEIYGKPAQSTEIGCRHSSADGQSSNPGGAFFQAIGMEYGDPEILLVATFYGASSSHDRASRTAAESASASNDARRELRQPVEASDGDREDDRRQSTGDGLARPMGGDSETEPMGNTKPGSLPIAREPLRAGAGRQLNARFYVHGVKKLMDEADVRSIAKLASIARIDRQSATKIVASKPVTEAIAKAVVRALRDEGGRDLRSEDLVRDYPESRSIPKSGGPHDN